VQERLGYPDPIEPSIQERFQEQLPFSTVVNCYIYSVPGKVRRVRLGLPLLHQFRVVYRAPETGSYVHRSVSFYPCLLKKRQRGRLHRALPAVTAAKLFW